MPKLAPSRSARNYAIHTMLASGDEPVRVAQRFGLKTTTVVEIYRRMRRQIKRDKGKPPLDIESSSLNTYIRRRLLAAGFKTFDELNMVTRAHVLTPKGPFTYWLGPHSIIAINMYMKGLGMPYRIRDEQIADIGIRSDVGGVTPEA